jgi:gliding motility-associated-like protein
MKKLKELLTVSIFLFAFAVCIAQTENKDVTITASGSGATQEDAKQAALRSAIEQAYGAFISTKTEMLNDQVVADEMISVSSGNIKSYEVLNQDKLPDGRWIVTLKINVSVDKLINFVEAKGVKVDVNGELFAMNIKQQLLNEQGEIKAVAEMVGLLHQTLQTSFDYTISTSEPKSTDGNSKNWKRTFTVTATANNNIKFCSEFCNKTLSALSLSNEEFLTYKKLGKDAVTIKLNNKNDFKILYLRSIESIKLLNQLSSNWYHYIGQYGVYNNLQKDTLFEIGAMSNYWKFSEKNDLENNEKLISYLFPSSQDIVATFTWDEVLSLDSLKKIGYYMVIPRGFVYKDINIDSAKNNGGFLKVVLPNNVNKINANGKIEMLQFTKLDFYELKIFNRWGERVYYTENHKDGWNGRVNNTGPMVSPGTYFYQISYRLRSKEQKYVSGSFEFVLN